MVASALLQLLLISASPPAQAYLAVDENAESAAAVSSAVRFEPFTGRLSTASRSGADGWNRSRHELTRVEARSRFSVELEPGAGRLVWRVGTDEPVFEALATDTADPNLLRIELANFDRRASLALERLELAFGGGRRELRGLGHGAMTRDLVTLFGPELGNGFRLTGELVTRGTPSAPGRNFVDVGLGRGRRVEVEIDGEGGVESVPPRVVRTPGRKSAIGYFAPGEDVTLRAVGDGFREWESGATTFAERIVDLARGGGDAIWTARFDPAVAGDAAIGAVPRPEGALSFSNTASILVPAGQPSTTMGKALPYPSQILVDGPVTGGLTDVNIALKDVSHPFPDDLDVVVVTPHGSAVLLVSDACSGIDVVAVDWWFDDDQATALPDTGPCVDGYFKLSVYDGLDDPFDLPAPDGPYLTQFSSLFGENVNGVWTLYAMDDGAGDYGQIAGGWELALETAQAAIDIPGSGTSGVAAPYPYTRTVAVNDPFAFGTILDLNVVMNSLWHQFPGDVDLLVVGPSGHNVMLMSDACAATELEDTGFTFDDEATGPLSSDATDCVSGHSYDPVDYGSAESLPVPAPAGPYGSALSVFDGDNPVGDWLFYFRDDGGGDVGFLSNYMYLQFRTTGIFRDGFETSNRCSWQTVPTDPDCDD